MSPLERQLNEDRAMRDAALGLFKTDLALVQADLKERGVGARLSARIGDGTMDIVDEAADFAQSNRGVVAAAIGAVVLWFARRPILDVVGDLLGSEDDEEEPGASSPRSRSN